ncbi:hypothetical protein AB4Y89_03775 [Terriglobus sp. 2YAB30_2]
MPAEERVCAGRCVNKQKTQQQIRTSRFIAYSLKETAAIAWTP